MVFLDAALPPAAAPTQLAPPWFRQTLHGLADGHAVLPPWTRWYSRDELANVIPAELFDDIDEACPRLPASYFDQNVSPPPDWTARRNSYLAFGDTYAAEFAFAKQHRWPRQRMSGEHLHFLNQPAAVAASILALTE